MKYRCPRPPEGAASAAAYPNTGPRPGRTMRLPPVCTAPYIHYVFWFLPQRRVVIGTERQQRLESTLSHGRRIKGMVGTVHHQAPTFRIQSDHPSLRGEPVFWFLPQRRVVDLNGPDPGRNPARIENVRTVGIHFGPVFGKVQPEWAGAGAKISAGHHVGRFAAPHAADAALCMSVSHLSVPKILMPAASAGVRPPMPPCGLM